MSSKYSEACALEFLEEVMSLSVSSLQSHDSMLPVARSQIFLFNVNKFYNSLRRIDRFRQHF